MEKTTKKRGNPLEMKWKKTLAEKPFWRQSQNIAVKIKGRPFQEDFMYHLILVLVAGYLGILLPFLFHFLHIPVQRGHYPIMICVTLTKKREHRITKRHKSSYLSINWSSFLCLSEICNLISCNLFLKLLISNARQLWSKTLKCLYV